MGMGEGQWGGYQNVPGYVWGTPMVGALMGMDESGSWQICFPCLSEQPCRAVCDTLNHLLQCMHTQWRFFVCCSLTAMQHDNR